MAIFNYTVTAQGSGAFLIGGNANPVLTLQAGNTYNFIVNAPGHPFWIKTDRVIGEAARYDVGVTNNGTESGTVTITLPADKVPPRLFYQCGKHLVMGNALTKFNVPAESIANLIVDQLPDFVRSDHPKFQLFMEAYYEWMNQPGNPWNEAKSLMSYQDIDTTVDDFLLHLEKEFVPLIPKNFDGDIRTLVKNIKDFYITKGSPKSYEFLFNILFNETIEFYYPKRDILRVSDGKWNSDTTIKITNPAQYDVFELSGQIIKQEEYYFDTDEQRFMYRDRASATVERAVQFFLGGELVTELFLSKVTGSFLPNVTAIDTTDVNAFNALPTNAKIYWFDELGNKHEYLIEPLLTGVEVTTPGSNYEANDVLSVISANGDTGVNAIAQIKSVLSGPIQTLNIINGGTNYKVGDIIRFNNDGTSGAGASGFVEAVDNSGTVPNAGAITAVRLVNGGFGYKRLPLVSIQIIDPSNERVGLNTPTPPTIVAQGTNIGGIKEIQIINFGALYYADPTIDFSAKGNGDASGTSLRGGLARYPGSFANDDGHISAAKYLQDNKFYQEFSYVIRTGLSINAYRDTIKTLVHPAGMELFGEVFISSKVETGLYDNGAKDVNDTFLDGGISIPRYIKLLQVFQTKVFQPYVQNNFTNGVPNEQPDERHFHELEITDKLGEDTKAVAASMGQFIRADLSWTDIHGVPRSEQRLLTITQYDEGVSISGTLSDGAVITLNHTNSEYALNPNDVSDITSLLYEDFAGSYVKEFVGYTVPYTATVTVTGRYRNDAIGLLPKLQFPKQEIGNVRIDMSPDQWQAELDPGTLNLQPIRKFHLLVPRIRPAVLGTVVAINPSIPTKTSYMFLGVKDLQVNLMSHYVRNFPNEVSVLKLTDHTNHYVININEHVVYKPTVMDDSPTFIKLNINVINKHSIAQGNNTSTRPGWGYQIGNLTGGDRLLSDIEHTDYNQWAGFTGMRPVELEHIKNVKVFNMFAGMTGTSWITRETTVELKANVETDVSQVVVLQPYAGNIRPINDVLFTGYKYFTGTIGDTLNREIVDYFGRDIVPNRPVGANGGPSYGQVALQTFIDLGLNISDFLDHEFGISEYFVYGANWQRSVELELPTLHIDNTRLETADIIITPIRVSVSAIETVTQARQDNFVGPVSIPHVVDNAFYSGNTNFGVQINSFDDMTIEEIENAVIRGYFTTVNPQQTTVYTRDNLNTITGTY
jgi:hypothetical protein